jgi:hypothetical protein
VSIYYIAVDFEYRRWDPRASMSTLLSVWFKLALSVNVIWSVDLSMSGFLPDEYHELSLWFNSQANHIPQAQDLWYTGQAYHISQVKDLWYNGQA